MLPSTWGLLPRVHFLLPQLGPHLLSCVQRDMAHVGDLGLTPRSVPSLRHQDSSHTVLVGVLTFLLVPVGMLVVYGLWKKRHRGSE